MFLLIFNFFILWSLKIFHFQGIFFIIPCVDSYTKVRVHLESVPVKWEKSSFAKHRILLFLFFAGGYEGAHIRCSSTRGQICFSFAKKESYPFLFSYLSSLTAGHSYLKVIFQILTKDSVTVFVDAIMYYKVVLMF